MFARSTVSTLCDQCLLSELEPLPGINKPMFYVGQRYSRFAWHVEDGLAHSISHLHDGNEKVWYIVNSKDKERFESFVACNIFDLNFVNDRYSAANIMTFKSTIFNPGELVAHQFRVNRIVQNKGSIVIVKSGSYHCGYNSGFNVAEAMNFCNFEWLSHGKKFMSSLQSRILTRNENIPFEYILHKFYISFVKQENPQPEVAKVLLQLYEHIYFKGKRCENRLKADGGVVREITDVKLNSTNTTTVLKTYGQDVGLSCTSCTVHSFFCFEICAACAESSETLCMFHSLSASRVCSILGSGGHQRVLVKRFSDEQLKSFIRNLQSISGQEVGIRTDRGGDGSRKRKQNCKSKERRKKLRRQQQ